MDALQIIIPAVTGILGLFIGYFLNQALYEKKRKDDLADRDFARRAAIHDMRIQEAREVIEKFSKTTSLMKEVARIFEAQDDFESAYKSYEYHQDAMERLPVMLLEALEKRTSIYLLLDATLENLFQEFFDKMQSPTAQMMSMKRLDRTKYHKKIDEQLSEIRQRAREIEERSKKGEIIDEDELPEYRDVRIPTKDVTEGIDLAKVQDDFEEAEMILTKMKARLDMVAREVPK